MWSGTGATSQMKQGLWACNYENSLFSSKDMIYHVKIHLDTSSMVILLEP